MNNRVSNNFSKLSFSFFYLPVIFLIVLAFFLYKLNCLNYQNYAAIQKSYFLSVNAALSQFPKTIVNLTQFGDELIFLSFISIFILTAPKIWEALISASLISALFSVILKRTFSVPRPAAVYDTHSFSIIGKTLSGHTSFPSGHSMTLFTILTVLLFAFMPGKSIHKSIWVSCIIIIGLMLVFTRVGVGAHYPLDVIAGSIIGFISGIAGILICQKYNFCSWINERKYYPVFMLLFLIGIISLINRIYFENLIIYYFALISLSFSQYKIIAAYVQK